MRPKDGNASLRMVDISLVGITLGSSAIKPGSCGITCPEAFTNTPKVWDPRKLFILLIGDSTTAEIGFICCSVDDKWQKLLFNDEGSL